MNRKRMLLSLPLSLLILPPLLAGNPGLYYPLFWLAALLLSPFFTAPLLAGESASGTDLLLLTGPLTDRALLFRLLKKGAVSLGSLFILPVTFMSLIRLAGGEDPGKILFFLPLFTGGIFFLAALGLAVSSFCHRPGRAWFFSYAILLPLNFLSPFLPRWTDPLFEGYLPFAVFFLLPSCILFFQVTARTFLAWKREDPIRKKKTVRLVPFLLILTGMTFIPGGMDLTFSGQTRLNRVTAREIRQLEAPLYVRWYRTSNYQLYRDGLDSLDAFLFSLRIKGGRKLHYRREHLTDREIDLMGKERNWTVQTLEDRGAFEAFYSVIEIEYRGRTETLPLVYNPIIAEEQALAAIQRLKEGSAPTAGIIIGRSDKPMEESWTILHGALEEYFSLEDYTGRVDGLMPGMPDCLFVLGGRDLSAWEVSQIIEYVREGGAALVTLSPYILDPVRTDRILPAGENPLLAELGQLGIYGGDAFIIDPDRGLYLSSGTDRPPDFYPLWFYTNGGSLFDYTALWSVPIHYAGDEEPIWLVESSKNSLLAGPLTDITPSTLNESHAGGWASYTTCLSLPEGKGVLTVLSGSESLSDIMAVADLELRNSAWIQSLAFYLSGNRELLELRSKSTGKTF